MSASSPMTPAEVEATEKQLRALASAWGNLPALVRAADALSAQAAEIERMRELVGDLERRARACVDLNKKAELVGNTGHASRLLAKALAYSHAADLARQALSVKAG